MAVTTATRHTRADREAEVLDEILVKANKDALTRQIDEFVDIISSEAFLGYVNEIGQLTTHGERRRLTEATATLEHLEQVGVPVHPQLRIATREFELPEDGLAATSPLVRVRPDLDPRMGWCVSLGFYLCVSYGG